MLVVLVSRNCPGEKSAPSQGLRHGQHYWSAIICVILFIVIGDGAIIWISHISTKERPTPVEPTVVLCCLCLCLCFPMFLSLSLFVFLSKILINCGLGVGCHRKEEGGHFKFIECRAEAAAVLASTYFLPQYHHKETSLGL